MGQFKKFLGEDWRYRAPSINNILGITPLKKKIRAATGINSVARWSPGRITQRVKQKLGIYGNDTITTLRQLLKYNKARTPTNILPKLGDED